MTTRTNYIPRDQRKKILFMCDDIRMHSGVATMGREIVMGTCHHYNYINLGGSVKHPEKGKMFDLSEATARETGVEDAWVKLIPTDGYGNPDMVRQILMSEKPDAILHFTDPRFWIWLYQMELEIRQKIPLLYYNIWDDVPYPMYNRSYYESCDGLFGISKQTVNINRQVLGREKYLTLEELMASKSLTGKSLSHYVPHGINSVQFRPLETEEELKKLSDFRNQVFGEDKKYDFVLYFNSRNIHRKHPADIILAYRIFCDSLPKEKADKCCLLMHTSPKDDNGTDLLSVKEALCPNYNIAYSPSRIDPNTMNMMYNISNVTIMIGSNEGFGLATAESIMAGVPIIVNVTGGLQDQCGFLDENDKPIEFTAEWGSNHDGRYKKHGIWVKPVFPSNRSIQGSIPTPYISDDRADFKDVAEAMMYWYLMPEEQRKKAGLEGRRWALNEGGLNAENMSNQIIAATDAVLNSWVPRERFSLINCKNEFTTHKMEHIGMNIPKIDIEKIQKEIK